LSDHLYIRFEVSPQATLAPPDREGGTPSSSPRWALKRLNGDALVAASIVMAWPESQPAGPDGVDVDEEAAWFRGSMSQICDTGMLWARPAPPRRGVYWWSPEIAELRAACVRGRRQYTRYRRRKRGDAAMEEQLYGTYREAKKSLQLAIIRAKTQKWQELLETIEKDPWGRPYRMVRNKLRAWAPPITESLPPGYWGRWSPRYSP